MPITIECSVEELEILLHAARESGDCLLILRGGDSETVCLRARAPRKPGRPRKVQAAAEGLEIPSGNGEVVQTAGAAVRG